jgi:hypothetical protein
MAATRYDRGDFSFITDADSVKELTDMYNAVSTTDNWENLKGFIPGDGGFMFCDKPEWFSQIHKAMTYHDHSGVTYGMTIRNIDYIAKHGWENFVLKKTNPDPVVHDRLQILELPYAIKEAESTLIAWIKRLENTSDIDSLNRLYYRVDEASQDVERLKTKLYRLSGVEPKCSDIPSVPPMPPVLVALRKEAEDEYEGPPQRTLPPMPRMGVPLMRSMSGMPVPSPLRSTTGA